MSAEQGDPVERASLTALMADRDSAFDWCLRRATGAERRGDDETAARWARLAGRMTELFGSSLLAHPGMEALVLGLARRLPVPADASPPPAWPPAAPVRWLHVLTQAYSTGGHTALCRRWIESDDCSDHHDALILDQPADEVSPPLARAVEARGGALHRLDDGLSILGRAAELRRRARGYDVVVLHVHMWDPIAAIAFGVAERVRVLYVNHADHLYWVGAAACDFVVNIRPSGEALCAQHRGMSRLMRLPLPIPLPADRPGRPTPERRAAARARLGVDAETKVFLTIGSAYKYHPMMGMNFPATARRLVDEIPNARVIAVGPSPTDTTWSEVTIATGGRVRADGRQADLTTYFDAADAYLEGFPFGSLTALLEAGLAGLPLVMAPGMCPLPFRSDDFGIELEPPADIDAYVAQAARWAGDPTECLAAGARVRKALLEWHCRPGWQAHLAQLRAEVLRSDTGRRGSLDPVAEMPDRARRFWWRVSTSRTQGDNALQYVLRMAVVEGLKPLPDGGMATAVLAYYRIAGRRLSGSRLLLGALALCLLPVGLAQRLFSQSGRERA